MSRQYPSGISVHAANVFWTNGIGNWDNPANWNTGTNPAPVDAAFINNGGTAVIDSLQAITTQFVILGATNGDTGNLSMTGGSLTTSSDIRIGNNVTVTGVGTVGGTGLIDQSGGAITLTGGNVNIGFGDTAVGTYNISGGSLLVNVGGILAVGNRGSGIVNQTGGSIYVRNTAGNAQVNLGRNGAFSTITTPPNPGKSSGQYTLSAGDLTVASIRYGNAIGAVGASTNVFNLQGTGLLTVSNIIVINTNAANSFNFSGGTLTALSIGMSLTNTGGKLSPASLSFGGGGVAPTNAAAVVTSPIGVTTFLGANGYNQGPGGILAIDLATNGNDFVSIGTNGAAILAGTISLTLLNNFDPAPGSIFDILTAGSIANAATVLGQTPSGFGFDPSIVSGGSGQLLRLTVVPEPGTFVLFGLSALGFVFRGRLGRKPAIK
ncbi:MAG: PEP-CTERM sorting domain-containing protein [Verrucomicrobiota bacterium]|nr:PEP-CTERM sorting domain-containing protein [Verrucomicrobiota bacterium]